VIVVVRAQLDLESIAECRLQAAPIPVGHSDARRDDCVLRRIRQHVVYGPAHVGVHRSSKRRVGGQLRVIERENETVEKPFAEIAHVAVTGMHPEDTGLVTAGLRVRRGSAHHLGPVRSKALDVLWMLIIVRERMIELGIRKAPCVMGARQREKSGLPAGELVQGRRHTVSLAYDSGSGEIRERGDAGPYGSGGVGGSGSAGSCGVCGTAGVCGNGSSGTDGGCGTGTLGTSGRLGSAGVEGVVGGGAVGADELSPPVGALVAAGVPGA